MNDINFDHIIKEPGVAFTAQSQMDQIEMIKRGISKKSLLRIAEFCSVSVKELAKLLPVSLRTIQRYHDDDLLDSQVSERVILIAEVLEKGMEVFGSRQKLQEWLHTPPFSAGPASPSQPARYQFWHKNGHGYSWPD